MRETPPPICFSKRHNTRIHDPPVKCYGLPSPGFFIITSTCLNGISK